jgi:AcrR family transcriptional regulator
MAATPATRISGADRRLQIMKVAKELFARHGFDGATTRQIADRAKVNEAIIFRHFPTKQDLYWAVIEHECEVSGFQESLEGRLKSGASDREIFAGIAEDSLRRRAKDSSLSRLLLFSALENHQLSQRFFETHVGCYFDLLADYIRKRIQAGAFRPVDPLIAARGFLGMVVYHSLIQDLYGQKRVRQFDLREVSETLTDLWLSGMMIREPSSTRQ